MQEYDDEIFNENELEEDFLEDCDMEIEEYDQEKADLNLRENHFKYVPEREGIGE